MRPSAPRFARLARGLALAALAAMSAATALHAQTPPAEPEGPYFVMTGSFAEKSTAQSHARTHGGWVLRTDLYSALTPGFFAVVHGPFDERPDAEAALATIQPTQPQAYVRSGGYPYLLPELGDPGLLAAFLGTVQVREITDPSPPRCAPPEEYQTVVFVAPATEARAEFEIGRVWLIDRTGEVIPVRPCPD
jgi:hypothetical protein